MKKGYKLTAALMTTAMMFAGMQVIHAAPPTTTGTEANPAQIKLRKGIEMPTGTSTPAGTATFKLTAKSVDGAAATPTNMPAIANQTVTFTAGDPGDSSTDVAGVKTVYKKSANLLAGVIFPHAGEYIYEVEETAGGFTLTNNATLSEVMEYSTKKYQMQVLVATNAAGTSVFVQSVTVGELNGGVLGPKVDEDDFKFINKFGRTHNVDPVNPGTNSDSALAIEKKVSGAGGNMSEYFPFSLKLTDPATNPSGLTIGTYKAMIVEGGAAIDPTPNGISGAAADHSFTISQGTAFTFKLKHGQKLVLLDLPVGAKYEASETDSKGHTANITVKANGVAGSESATTNVPSTYIGEAANRAVVRNDKIASTPTGILMNNLPYVILIAIAIAGIAAVAGRKRLES